MNENKYNPDGKDIRFINSDYKDLFHIPDGGYITISCENGEQLTRQCKFHDEYHVDVGNNLYHICEFAERMEQNGSTYAPCPKPEMVNGYIIYDRMPVKDKVFILAYNKNAEHPWITMQGVNTVPGYNTERHWPNRSDAWTDYFRRTDGENRGIQPIPKVKDTGAR